MKVLIVDDESKICQLIVYLIDWKSMGLEIVGISNDGKSAYESVCKNRPDIVITDIRLPSFDGLELIRLCKEKFPDISFIIISGYSEFEFAKNAIRLGVEDYLLKPIKKKELESTLKKIIEKRESFSRSEEEKQALYSITDFAKDKIKQSFLNRIISYSKETNPKFIFNLNEINDTYQCRFKQEHFAVVVFQLFVKNKTAVMDPLDFLASKLEKIVTEELHDFCEEFISVIQNECVVCLINADDKNLLNLKKQFHKIRLQTFNELFSNIVLMIGVGNGYADIKDTVLSCREAERSLLDRFCGTQQYLFEYSNMESAGKNVSDIVNVKMRNDLIAAQERMDVDTILSIVGSLKNELAIYRRDSNLIYNCVLELIDILQFGSKNYDIYFQKFNLDEGIRKIGNIMTYDELFDWLKNDIIVRYQDFASKKKVAEKKPLISAKQYIYDNYNKNLSLKSVSEHIGFNPTYFSVLFKKETGKNFLEYLTELRIKNAKAYLISTDMDIAEIAIEVGYNDLKYFSKLFKKMAGINPSEYRKLYG